MVRASPTPPVRPVLAEAHWTSTWSSSLRHRRSFSEGVTALVTAAARWCGRCAGGEGALLAEGVVALLLLMLLAGVVSVAALSLSAARAWVLSLKPNPNPNPNH